MPTTTNFGWTTPADTDLVKDGASAIRTLGNGVDSSFVDLKGGTTGQVLSKATNTDLDFTWITPVSALPTFSATRSAFTTISTNTFVKLPINTEAWDTANCYDSTTNYRFTPNVSGYYQVNGSMATDAPGNTYRCAIYKNGTLHRSSSTNTAVSAVVYFNGTTDYVELYGYAQANGYVETESFFDAIGIRS